MEELSEQKKSELRHIADLTFEAILAANAKFSKLKAKEATEASA